MLSTWEPIDKDPMFMDLPWKVHNREREMRGIEKKKKKGKKKKRKKKKLLKKNKKGKEHQNKKQIILYSASPYPGGGEISIL